MASELTQKIYDLYHSNPQITYREIAKILSIKSTSTVAYHVKKLLFWGVLGRVKNQIFVLSNHDYNNIITVPYYGTPSSFMKKGLNMNNPECYIPLPRKFMHTNPQEPIALIAEDNSMYPGIKDKDLILFEVHTKHFDPRNGDVYLCVINNKLKIRRFIKKETREYLISDNLDKEQKIMLKKKNCNVKILYKMFRLGLNQNPYW